MKTRLNLLNQTANAAKISGGGNSRTTKHLFAIFALLLTLGVGNAWGGDNQCGFWGESESYVKFWVNGETVTFTCRPDGVSDLELGYVDHMYLSEIRALTWKYNDGNVCNVTMHYGINTSRHGSTGSDYTANYNNDGYNDWTGKEGDDKDKTIQQFKISPSGLNLVEGLTPGQSYYLDFYLELQGNLSNSSGCYGDQRHRNNKGGNYHIHFTVSDSKSKFTKGSFLYFDARNLTNWKAKAFDTKFFFKKHNNPWSDIADANGECLSTNALEDWVYYIQIPDGEDANYAYEGAVQINRVRPEGDPDENYWWNNTNIALAGTRANANQNCLTGSGDAGSNWDPTWTTYCPPMSSVSLSDNGTTNWGGNGSSETPYLVPTGGDIKVHVTASASALDDANMTAYYQFKKAGSDAGSASATNSATITASSTTGTKEAVTVEAYNYYNSTSGTSAASSAIYYEARTPYTISYNKGANGTGSRESEIKLEDVTFTLPGAVFTRTGYTQTGWATSDGGTKAYELSASYTDNAAVTLYPFWTPKTYTIRLEGMEADGGNDPIDVDVTYDGVLSQVTPHTKTNYTFDGYWTSEDVGVTLGHRLINANGNWIKDVTGYTGNDGAGHPTWVHDYPISLYAKWTETPYTITPSVEPAGTGLVNTVTDAHLVTPSSTITATPANEAWIFDRWEYGTNVGYSSGEGNAITVTASQNSTIIAHFKPRYALVGTLMNGNEEVSGGNMPGWEYANAIPFTNNSFTALGKGDGKGVDISCTRSLNAGATYKFMILDRSSNGGSYGVAPDEGEAFKALTEENQPLDFLNQDNQVFFYTAPTSSAMNYTFRITNITENDGKYYPTVTIERPHQMHMGHKRVNIDGTDYNDNTGGTLTASISESPVSNGNWFNYGSDITYTAAPAGGYTVTWYSNNTYSSLFGEQPENTWTNYNVTGDENVYAQFTENATTVTINANNTRGGSITVGGSAFTWGNTKTAGVTTKRALVVTPNTGYNFTGWELSSTPDFELQGKDPETDTDVTLAGLGNGSTGTLTANFAAKTYTVTLDDDQGGAHNGTATATYHTTALSVSTHAVIDGWMRLGYWNTSGIKVTDADGRLIANVENYTNSDGEWIYNGDVTLYAHWYREVTLDKNGGTEDGLIGVDYKGIGSSLKLPTRSGYSVEGFYAEAECTTKVMNPDGSLLKNVSGYTDSDGKWINKTVDKLYAKWIFIIYRTGDKSDDPRAQSTDVESYAGGTISEAIEYRMKVHTLDQWTSLCLPFEVNAVKVWDPADGPAYFDIVPYYRTGGKFYNGHYIIRTPKTATDLAIAEFDQWNDPTSATGYVPAKNTPYIIQWHDGYFLDKYISFFGAAGQSIPSSMSSVRAAPSSDNVVNVYGNDAMVSGSVRDAYLLESDYGSSGAWLRENIGTNRTINPFECYILANSATTTRYRILRRGAVPDDTPTGWDDVINAEPKTDIMVYTITGFPVARYYDCSFTEAAQRLHREQGEGIYILRSANESVKLMVGEK